MRSHSRVLAVLLIALLSAVAFSQDAVKLAPKIYKVLFENERVRVTEERLKPGEKEPMHTHPYGVLACFLTDAHIRTTFPDGRTSEASNKAGATVWRGPVAHVGENIGDTEIHELMIEPKSASERSGGMDIASPAASDSATPNEPMPASQEPHHHVKYQNQDIRILEVLLEPGESSFFHKHSLDIVYVTLADAVARAQEQGKDWGPATAFNAGTVSFDNASKTPHTHRLKNVSKTRFHTINIEFLH